MASRSERADALRRFAGQLHAFQDETLIKLQRLRLDLIYSDMDEEDRAAFSLDFERAADLLTEALRVMFEAQRVRLAALAQAVEALGMEEKPASLSGLGSGASPGSAARGGYTGETIMHGKEVFEVWSFAGVDPACVDWGADIDFPRKFSTEKWKGRDTEDYRELMGKTPALLAQCRTSGEPDVPGDLALARDAYFGSDRIRLEIVNDRISVINGRHRLMAAIECGASIPVSVARVDAPDGDREPPPSRPASGPGFEERDRPLGQERREMRGPRLR